MAGTAYASVFSSQQLAPSPVSGYFLKTNGATSSWAVVSGGGGTPAGTSTNIQYNLNGAFGAIPGSQASSSDSGGAFDELFQRRFDTFSTSATDLVFTDVCCFDNTYPNPSTVIYRLWSFEGDTPSDTYLQGTFTTTLGGVNMTFTDDANGDVTGYVLGKSFTTDGGATYTPWVYTNIITDGSLNGTNDDSGYTPDSGETPEGGFPNSTFPGITSTYINYQNGTQPNSYGIVTTGGASISNGLFTVLSNGFTGFSNPDPKAPIDLNVPNSGIHNLLNFSDSAGGPCDVTCIVYDAGNTGGLPAVWQQLQNGNGSGGFNRPLDFPGGYVFVGRPVPLLDLGNQEEFQAYKTPWSSAIAGFYDDPVNGSGTEREMFDGDGSGYLSTNNIQFDSSGDLTLLQKLGDETSSFGSSGMVPVNTGSGFQWMSTSSLGISSGLAGGTNGRAARWTSPTSLSTGILLDDGTVAGVNATTSTSTFDVRGNAGASSVATFASSTGAVDAILSSAGNLGIGTTTPSYPLDVYGNQAGGVALFERFNPATNAALGVVKVKATSTGTPADGFGPAFQFYSQGSNGVENYLADIRALRSGADNSGALTFNTSLLGTTFEDGRFTPLGSFGIGTTSPVATLTIVPIAGTAPFYAASSTGAVLEKITPAGHLVTGGPTPVLTSCGTSPSITGNDRSGQITFGTGALLTSCTVTFAVPYTGEVSADNKVHVFVNQDSGSLGIFAAQSVTRTGFVITTALSGATGDAVSYEVVASN